MRKGRIVGSDVTVPQKAGLNREDWVVLRAAPEVGEQAEASSRDSVTPGIREDPVPGRGRGEARDFR